MLVAWTDVSDWMLLIADNTIIALLIVSLALLAGALYAMRMVSRSRHSELAEPQDVAEDEAQQVPQPTSPPPSAASPTRAPETPQRSSPPTPKPKTPPMPAPIEPSEAEAKEASDPCEAAKMWERLARWDDAARCYETCGMVERAGEIRLAREETDRALPLLQEALSQAPEKESLRLRVVGTLLDRGQWEQAEGLVQSVLDPEATVKASGAFVESVARNFEAVSSISKAIGYYEEALRRDESLKEAEQRLLFLRQMKRLNGTGEGLGSPATELLDKYIRESSIIPSPSPEELAAEDEPITVVEQPEGHEIIVGHLALGCQQTEPSHSVRSVFSLSRRFTLERLLSETPRSAVFEARDRLLDYKVALKLVRLNDSEAPLDILKERLRALAQLNHPNLAKLTFVDREGHVLRVATEYLPGGNLRDFVTKLEGVGAPLLLRMCMHLASGLHTAHVRGVPHGDLRPENILVGPDQRIKLVDFAFSPIPVRRINFARVSPDGTDPGKPAELYSNAGVQSDLLQFGELLDFLLSHSRRSSDLIAGKMNIDPAEELKELVERLRQGSFMSMLRLWQVLEQIFERTHSNSGSDNPTIRP